jgi:hypothetical protein
MPATGHHGEVTIPVRCGRALHRVVVKPGRGRSVKVATPDHTNADAEAVLIALGASGPPCFEVQASIDALRRGGLAGLEAARWIAIAGDARSAKQWADSRHDIESASPWIRAGVSDPAQVEAWGRLGIEDATQMARWAAVGVRGPNEAAAWARVGVTRPYDVTVWKKAGAVNGDDADAWVQAGASSPGEVLRWRYQGVTASTLRSWRSAGIIDPAELPVWFQAGVDSPAELQGWYSAGVGHPDQMERWAAAGVTRGEDAASWVRPRLVTGPEEILAWRQAGITDPDRARTMILQYSEPASVAHHRAVALSRLRFLPDGTDGRVATQVCRGGDLLTEIYWYAYDHSCIPAVSTHWYTVDFACDEEIRDSRRRGLVHQPAVEAAGGVVSFILARTPSSLNAALLKPVVNLASVS